MNNKKIVCVIPARLQSTRFPEKILSRINNKTLIELTWIAATKINIFDNVIIAIDSEKTAKVIKQFGAKYLMTSNNCKSGTDRLIEIFKSKKIDCDIWVNWQADEPLINKKMIIDLLQSTNSDADIWTLKIKINTQMDVNNPNITKVVCDNHENAIYFSRNPIPHYRDKTDFKKQQYYKHIGIYAFTRNALHKISQAKKSYLEEAEKLEQLSFLANNIKIKVHKTNHNVIGIDVPQDLEIVENMIKKIGKSKNLASE